MGFAIESNRPADSARVLAPWLFGQQSHDHAVLKLGQLKTLAAPLYEAFAAAGFSPVDLGLPSGSVYPWDQAPSGSASDDSPAVLGQVKLVFSFRLELAPAPDSNGDGLPDWWADLHDVTNPLLDADNDGLSNLQEFHLGLDPNETDSDNNTLDDGQEDADKDLIANSVDPDPAHLNPRLIVAERTLDYEFWASHIPPGYLERRDNWSGEPEYEESPLNPIPFTDLATSKLSDEIEFPMVAPTHLEQNLFRLGDMGPINGGDVTATAGSYLAVTVGANGPQISNPDYRIYATGVVPSPAPIIHRRIWMTVPSPAAEAIKRPFLKVTEHRLSTAQTTGWETTISDAEVVELSIPPLGTISNPIDLEPSLAYNLDGTATHSYPGFADPDVHEMGGYHQESVAVRLLPVDLDIVHPATGELDEGKQSDPTKGGYVAVRRDDETPVTKLVIREGASVEGMKYRIKFDAGANFKIWKDEARTQSVTSEQTEFEPDQETTLYLEGLKKSDSIGQHEITLQAVIGGESHDAETIYSTVVEAEFDVWLNIFIPVQWTDFPATHPIHIDYVTNPLDPYPIPTPIYRRKIAAGDDRSFNDEFFDDPVTAVDDIVGGTASRAHMQVTIIPFKDLDEDGIKDDSYKDAIGESYNYRKDGSVPDPGAGYSATNRLLPQPILTQSGRAGTGGLENPSTSIERYGVDENAVQFRLKGSADNPIVNPSPAIDWDFQIAITVNNANVLAPKWLLLGDWQDGFPGYEIYIRDSDGDQGDNKGAPIYQYDPIPLGRTPVDLFPDSVPGSIDETVTPANGEVP